MSRLNKFWPGLIVFGMISACAHQSKPNLSQVWQPFGFEGLLEKVNYIAGEEAINCGYHDLLTDKGRDSYDEGFDCVIDSDEVGVPFKIGTVRVPRDSYAYEVIIRDANADYWFITYDRIWWAENENQLWVSICQQATFTLGRDHVEDCQKITGEDWEKGGLEDYGNK